MHVNVRSLCASLKFANQITFRKVLICLKSLIYVMLRYGKKCTHGETGDASIMHPPYFLDILNLNEMICQHGSGCYAVVHVLTTFVTYDSINLTTVNSDRGPRRTFLKRNIPKEGIGMSLKRNIKWQPRTIPYILSLL